MKHSRTIQLMTMAVLMLPLMAHAQLLKGKFVNTKVDDAAVGYTPDGNMLNQRTYELNIADDGTFSFDMELTEPTADVVIYVGETGTFGAHLVKGKTVEMTITKKGNDMVVTFKGPNADVCRFVNRQAQAYDMSKYGSMDPSTAKTYEEYRAILEKENSCVVAMLPSIKDKKSRDYYKKLSDANYRWLKLLIISDECQKQKTDTKDHAEYQEIIKDVDVNDNFNYQTNISLWAMNNMMTEKFGGSNEKYCYEQMALAKRLVTNPNLKKIMVQLIGQNYYLYGDGSGDYETFTNKLREFAGDNSAIVDNLYKGFLETQKAREKTAAGTAAPDITLDTPDGKQVQLKDICKGKFTYIDVWATWCGPCKREIPFMAKLVEQFKDNDKVQFISISVDENVEAWKKMIADDKPAWAQYNIHGEVNKQFSGDWGITGIPRFIMIDKDGNIFSADASRPSNEETAQTIIEQTK